jgi:hypothetical protein
VRHGGRRARRIDWILLKDGRRRLRTEAHEILRDRDEQSFVYPSDHYPLLAMFARPADTRPSGGALRCGPAGQPPAGPRRRPRCWVEIYPVG